MKIRTDSSRGYEFCFPALDTLLLVEDCDGAVLIRATRNTFSAERKVAFVRHLVAEGFIPEEYRWWAPEAPGGNGGLRWVIDYSWLRFNSRSMGRSRQRLYSIVAGSALVWLMMMATLLVTQSLAG